MKLPATFKGSLALATIATLIVAAIVVATTVDFKFAESTALQPDSSDSSTGAVSSAPAVTQVAVEDVVNLPYVRECPDFKSLMIGGVTPRIIIQEEETLPLTYYDGVPPLGISSGTTKK